MANWMLFSVPCPTPAEATAAQLLQKRIDGITPEMQQSARLHGCRFHRAWAAADGSAFHAIACWENREGAGAFYREWQIEDEEGETITFLEGDIGLVPEP